MRKLITFFSSFFILHSALATPMLFSLLSLTGVPSNRQIFVTPDVVQNPLVLGTNLVPTFPFILQPVGGQVLTNLASWGYTIKVDGWPRSAHINVPQSTNVINVATLIGTNQFSPITIVYGPNLSATNGIALVTNLDGTVTITISNLNAGLISTGTLSLALMPPTVATNKLNILGPYDGSRLTGVSADFVNDLSGGSEGGTPANAGVFVTEELRVKCANPDQDDMSISSTGGNGFIINTYGAPVEYLGYFVDDGSGNSSIPGSAISGTITPAKISSSGARPYQILTMGSNMVPVWANAIYFTNNQANTIGATNTTYTNTGFAITVPAGRWKFTGKLSCLAKGTTSGLNAQVICTNGLIYGSFSRMPTTGNAAGTMFDWNGTTGSGTGTSIMSGLADATAQYSMTYASGIIILTTNTTFTAQISQRNAADIVNPAIITTNSFMLFEAIPGPP